MMTLDFEVWCSCGQGICSQTTVEQHRVGSRAGNHIIVEPCEQCLERARKEALKDGETRIDELESELDRAHEEIDSLKLELARKGEE